MDETQIKILLIDKSLTEAHVVQDMLKQVDRRMFSMYCAETLSASLGLLARYPIDVVLVDLSLPDSEGLETFETIRRHALTVPIVIYASLQNEALALSAVEKGAQDYLIKGRMTSAALVRVLKFAVARQRSQTQAILTPGKKATTIGVLGTKGGVGSTTIACHFSVELGKHAGAKVLLLDTDAAAASSALLMRTKSENTLLEVTQNLHRLDADYWKRVVCASASGVDVLQAPGVNGPGEPLVLERVGQLLRFTQPLYDSVVVDLGRLGPLSISLLDQIQQIYVVTSADIPELYEAVRVLRKLKELGFGERLRVILNRASKNSLGSREGLEEALGHPIYWTVPDCSKELFDTYSTGQFMEPGTSLQKQMAQMVAKSLGNETAAPNRGVLNLNNLARALGYSRKPQAVPPLVEQSLGRPARSGISKLEHGDE